MKQIARVVGILLGLSLLVVLGIALLLPWMDRWGARDEEIAASYPGDEFIPHPARIINRAISIEASPEQIYPWIIQLGAERGGYYSYEWLETRLLRCPMTNAEEIHDEWQDLKVGDEIKMCPGDFGPKPWEVARLEADRAMVLGHSDNGVWLGTWQLIIAPEGESTRLILRSRDTLVGGFWEIIRPGVFIMERGMLLGIKERAEFQTR